MIKQLRASGAEFLLVDGGNALFGAVPWNPGDPRIGQSLEKAKVIIAGYNRMRYHAMAVGVGEIGIGLAHIKELEKLMEFPLLCANLVDSGSDAPVFKPSAIVTVGGVVSTVTVTTLLIPSLPARSITTLSGCSASAPAA